VFERLELLAANFVIDTCFFAVLANHLHLVLRTTPRLVKRMGTWEVARRWLRVFPGRRVLDGKWVQPTEQQVQALAEDKEKIKQIRKRLASISWFMAALSEYIARRSNLEDDCTGRFFEGRFSCREVTDERALLVCGLYVDLNPVRAGEVRTATAAAHSSAALRLRGQQATARGQSSGEFAVDGWLAPLTLQPDHLGDTPSSSGRRASDKGLLPMSQDAYLRLLNWCGRQVDREQCDVMPEDLAPLVARMGVVPEELVATVRDFPRRFRRFAGTVAQFRQRAAEVGRRWLQGVRCAARVFR
jgi:hypothetical protein